MKTKLLRNFGIGVQIWIEQHLKPPVCPKNEENPTRGVEVREKVKSTVLGRVTPHFCHVTPHLKNSIISLIDGLYLKWFIIWYV